MNIAVLGTGNMGKALIGGLRRSYGNQVGIVAYDKNSEALQAIGDSVTIAEPASWFAGGQVPDAVIIAVKPFDIASALTPLIESGRGNLEKPLWISIAAGKSISFFRNILPPGARICRVMPNAPALINEAMSAYALSENAGNADAGVVEKIFNACGKTVAVPEKFMNAVTGLSGSGPGYVFFFIESLIEAGVMAGLPQSVARDCALQTVIGAAKMAAASPEDSLTDLKMKVMTPGGTTASAFMVLEHHSFKSAIIKAVVAATKRSEQLEK